MKHLVLIALAALTLSCSSTGGDATPAASTSTPTTVAATPGPGGPMAAAYTQGSKKKGDKGLCVVCATNDGTTEEETAAEVIDYQGKTYVFCSESEKAEFISNPGKYAVKP